MSDQEHHLRTLIQKLERDNADLRAKLARLDGLTNWVCSCGGTDCKGQEENAALREKVDDWENAVLHALDHRSDEQHCTCVAPLVGKVKQLEREYAALRKERNSYRYRSEQIWGLRKEIQAALGVPADCEGEEALKRGLESIKLLRSTAVEVCALARVWATVWHDKLSTESLQRFAELEQQILKGAKL